MCVRISIETVLLRKATCPSDFFSISVGKKNKKIHRVGGGGGEGKIPKERKMLRRRDHQVPYPFSLYKESATGARWLCAFLKHQLPEWSCREAMHCGTGVSDFVIIFDCLLLKISLYCSWYCGVYLTRTVSVVICFSAVSLPLLLFW